MLILLRERRQEDDRDRARALALLDHLGRLEPVHARHLDVEQDDREVVAVQQDAQRLRRRAGLDELVARAARGSPRAPAGSAAGRRRAGATVRAVTRRHLRKTAELDEQRGDLARAVRPSLQARVRAPRAASRRAPPSRGPATIAAPPSSRDRARGRGAVGVRAGQDDADAALAVRLGGRLKQNVDRGPRVLHGLVDGQREHAALDEQVVVGRREVDACRAHSSLSSASRTLSRVTAPSRSRNAVGCDSGARCCAITTAASSSAGSPPSSVRSASSPPQEAPIATRSCAHRIRR